MKTIVLSVPGSTSAPGERELVISENLVETAGRLLQQGRSAVVVSAPDGEVEVVAAALRSSHPSLRGVPGPGADGLMAFLDDQHSAIVAPPAPAPPLFLISIPKSGTHLLYELARALGYGDGIVYRDRLEPRTWYCIEFSNSHTRAADFLIDTTRRAPFGNKHHPFFRSPALFIYRNPRDILVSESNWFHKAKNSPLAGYLSALSQEERLLRLVDDPWLLGSIRERVGGFVPWLDFPNVVPISFEELVGSRGGGSDRAQLDLIWSLQLKLRAAGRPAEIARRLFNPESPTFTEGRIGAWREQLTPRVKEKLRALGTDYLEMYGYADEAALLPSRTEEFRRRPLRPPAEDFSGVPIGVDMGYLQHNIILYRGRYHAVPQVLGPVDLARQLPLGVRVARSLDEARLAIVRRRLRFGLLWRAWTRMLARLRRR